MADVMILWYDIADYPSAGAWEVNCCQGSRMGMPPLRSGTSGELYFDPDDPSIPGCGQSVNVTLMAEIDEADPVTALLLNFTFDNTCLEITDAVGNTANWTSGVTIQNLESVNENGSLTISANVGTNSGITGTIEVVTLTLKCINCEGCTCPLDLTLGEYTTEMLETVLPDLNDGSFTCGSS